MPLRSDSLECSNESGLATAGSPVPPTVVAPIETVGSMQPSGQPIPNGRDEPGQDRDQDAHEHAKSLLRRLDGE